MVVVGGDGGEEGEKSDKGVEMHDNERGQSERQAREGEKNIRKDVIHLLFVIIIQWQP